MKKKSMFVRFAERTAQWSGHPITFITAVTIVVVWAVTGPVFGFSDTWQLIINTGTTILTFLMVFLIQNTQNRDAKAVQLKLDELIRATQGAHTVLLDLEELSDKEIENIRKKYEMLAERSRQSLREGDSDTDMPEILIDEHFLK